MDLENGIFPGAIEAEEAEEDGLAGAAKKPEGVHKHFLDIIYNQLEVDPYSCTLVATYGALSNTYDKIVPYELMRGTLARMLKDGVFVPKVGAQLKDGVRYALEDFNSHYGTKIKYRQFAATFENIHEAMVSSAVVHGMKYAPAILSDEEDNATLDKPTSELVGKQGHAMFWCKTNAENYQHPCQAKYVQSYSGKKVRNVIFVQDYVGRMPMFFKYAFGFFE